MAIKREIINGELVITSTNNISKLEVLRRIADLQDQITELQAEVTALNNRISTLTTLRNQLIVFASQM